jgi:hypothetical protein
VVCIFRRGKKKGLKPAGAKPFGIFFHFRPTSKRSDACYTWRRNIFLSVKKTGCFSKTILLELKNEKWHCTYGM